MSVLSDQDIARELAYGELDVSPVDLKEQLQPNSLDIRLNDEFSIFEYENKPINIKKGIKDTEYDNVTSDKFIIEPGEFVLADTIENFNIPDYLYGQIHGRSSIGRLGLEVHSTAGLVDSGYNGSITLELKNNNKRPITIYSGMRIGQIVFHELSSKCNNPYSAKHNKYQDQSGVVHSRINEEL